MEVIGTIVFYLEGHKTKNRVVMAHTPTLIRDAYHSMVAFRLGSEKIQNLISLVASSFDILQKARVRIFE